MASVKDEDDEIISEVRRNRDAYAKQFNYDLDAIFADLKRREAESGRPLVKRTPKRRKQAASNS